MDILHLICLAIISTLSILLIIIIKLNYRIRKTLQMQSVEYEAKVVEEVKRESAEIMKELASRTALLIDVSHEMRSPLQGIVSISEVLSTKWNNIEDEVKRKQISTISEAGSELIKFVNDLLNYEKFNAGKMVFEFAELNLHNIIEHLVDYCSKLYLTDKNIKLSFDSHQAKEALINGDKDRIKQLIMNLLINAIKYSDKGEIIASLKPINYNSTLYWEFSLSDQGPGIAFEEIENIFEPFTRSMTKTTVNKVGSGIGLAMCKQIVEAHKGKIWAKNNNGKGSIFSFIIPSSQKTIIAQNKG